MEKIRCRVWDRNNLCYIYSDNKDYLFALTTDGGLEVWYVDQGEFYDLVFHSSPEWYVGFKDKNGVEIFEGDIVKGHYYKACVRKRLVGKVAFGYNGWVIEGVKQYKGTVERLTLSYEIIGNVHENPELLEVLGG